jgi:hypothetical protein
MLGELRKLYLVSFSGIGVFISSAVISFIGRVTNSGDSWFDYFYSLRGHQRRRAHALPLVAYNNRKRTI